MGRKIDARRGPNIREKARAPICRTIKVKVIRDSYSFPRSVHFPVRASRQSRPIKVTRVTDALLNRELGVARPLESKSHPGISTVISHPCHIYGIPKWTRRHGIYGQCGLEQHFRRGVGDAREDGDRLTECLALVCGFENIDSGVAGAAAGALVQQSRYVEITLAIGGHEGMRGNGEGLFGSLQG